MSNYRLVNKNDVSIKKNNIIIIIVLFLVLIGIVIIGLFINKNKEQEDILLYESITLIQGDILELSKIVTYDIDGYSWNVSKDEVVKIDENKDLVALKNGEAYLNATYEKKSDKFLIKVIGIEDYVQVKDIKLDKSKVSLKVGETYNLSHQIVPDNASNHVVSWYSSNDNIVTVSKGVITAISGGNAYVSVVSEDGNVSFCEVVVSGKENLKEDSVSRNLESISFIEQEITLSKGESNYLEYSLLPSDSSTKLFWSSSDIRIVDVTEDGMVTARDSGEAIITVKSINGLSDSIKVIVPVVLPTSLELGKESLNIVVGDDYRINATIFPDNATNKDIEWTSSDNKIVSVDKKGNVKALAKGNAIVTAITSNNIKKELIINVVDKAIAIEDIKIKANTNSLYVGDTLQLFEVLTPEAATNVDLTWESNNKEVATVSKLGEVKGIKAGKATITVKTTNGKTDTIEIIVLEPEILVEQIKVDKSDLTLAVGDTYKIKTDVVPSNATNKNLTCSLTYSSKSESVVSVSKDCLITAKTGGAATVTVASDNGKTTKVKVTVKNYNLILDNDLLETSGTKIVKTGNKKEVVLKGYNLGAWLSRSFAMMPVVPIDESKFNGDGYSCINSVAFYELLQDNPNVKTKANAQKLSRTLYENYITDTDWDLIAQTGANVVRLPFEYNLFNLEGDEYALSMLEKAVNEANERGLYVIIDLHVAPGRQNGGGYCDNYTFLDDTATGENNRKKVIEIWKKIAKRFKGKSGVAGYDLLNEPQIKNGNSKVLFDYYDAAYEAIRSVEGTSRNHIIFMEETCVYCGYEYGDNPNIVGLLPDPDEYGWENVVYSSHDYYYKKNTNCPNGVDINTSGYAMINRAKQKLEKVKEKRNTYNVPYYVGEFSMLGSVKNDSSTCPYQYSLYTGHMVNWTELMNLYEANGLSYTAWTYKASWDKYYGLVYYGTGSVAKANLLTDSYATLESKFKSSSSQTQKFNSDFYGLFIKQFGGRVASEIKLDKSSVTINKGDSTYVNYVITPNTTINKNVTWSSSDSNVVKVDSNTGKITGVKAGTATITITWKPLLYSGPATTGIGINDNNYVVTTKLAVIVK